VYSSLGSYKYSGGTPHFLYLYQGPQNYLCDNKVAVSVLGMGRGVDPILQSISRNLWVTGASLDCDIEFAHVRGVDNKVADILSRWEGVGNPVAKLFGFLNNIPIWCSAPVHVFDLNSDI
jgi:hypothetical protein